MTNTKKVVLAKLFGKPANTKLSKARKIDFSLADELDAAYEEAQDALRMTSIQIDAAYELVSELIGQIPDPETFYQDIEGPQARLQMWVGRAQAAADELGIDPKDSINGYVEAIDIIESFKELEDTIASYKDDIDPILSASGLR